MKVNFTKDKELLVMVNEFLSVIQKFWIAENSDQYWDALLDATEALNQKYNNPTLLALIVGFVGAKEDEYCREGSADRTRRNGRRWKYDKQR